MQQIFLATLSLEIRPSTGVLQLLPAGDFRANDGRPAECAAWRVTPEAAQRIVTAFASRKKPMVLDYEHQTLSAATSGIQAPAAAWIKAVEWREGEGLFATDVEWTARASQYVEAKEYRFISPVFTYDADGNVLQLINAALTNNPALDDLDEVMLAAACRLMATTSLLHTPTAPEKESHMKELLAALRLLLNLPESATEAQALVALNALATKVGATAAASVDLVELLDERDTRIAALTSATPDPAKYVPIETMTALRQQIAALTHQSQQGQLETVITAALSDGRLLPAQESWARELGKSSFAQLTQYLSTAEPIAALRTTQTGGREPNGGKPIDAMDDSALAVCRQMGLSADEFNKTKGAAK
ncbi:phage protease [Pandoraea apista]|uniref:phage protease n=1 Tax=Pandoraea apista TaxID=93218 RepID=UPI000F67B244|nr:phage protease [Pandoraea apista]RRW90601.1 hypothetical protein EGJ54_21865 [Pandoraea apista]RRX00393.1 hypothetical protein EGJ56_19110 [Pandoraea apista]